MRLTEKVEKALDTSEQLSRMESWVSKRWRDKQTKIHGLYETENGENENLIVSL